MSSSVNELSGNTMTVVPRNLAGKAFTPTNMRYRLDDKVTGTAIIAWTVATPSTSVAIAIPAASNAIIDTSLPVEEKVFTVEFDYGLTIAHTEDFTYEVVNLQFIS